MALPKNGCAAIGAARMDYVKFGRGGRVLVMLPGLSDGLSTVRGKAVSLALAYPALGRAFTVYLFSRRRDLPEGYAIRDMARDQAEAMQTLGISSAVVLGVSEGGMIAQELAIGYPEAVGTLLLAVTAPCMNEISAACLRDWTGMAERGDHAALMIDTAERSYSEAYLKKLRPLYPLLGRVGRPKDGYRRFCINIEAIRGFDASDWLSGIACPTAIIGGEDDRIVGADASRALHAGIPHSRLYLYPGLGHGLYDEAKDFQARVIELAGK